MKIIGVHNGSFHASETKFYLVSDNVELCHNGMEAKMNFKKIHANNFIGTSHDINAISQKYPEFSEIFAGAAKSDYDLMKSVNFGLGF